MKRFEYIYLDSTPFIPCRIDWKINPFHIFLPCELLWNKKKVIINLSRVLFMRYIMSKITWENVFIAQVLIKHETKKRHSLASHYIQSIRSDPIILTGSMWQNIHSIKGYSINKHNSPDSSIHRYSVYDGRCTMDYQN